MALTYAEYQLLLVTISWIGGFLPMWAGRVRWRWWQAVGLALVLSPFVRMAIGVYYDLAALIETTVTGGFVVLPAYTTSALWEKAGRHALHYLVVPAVGLFMMWNGRPTRDGVARSGLAPRDTVAADATHGLALFLFVLLAYGGALLVAAVAARGLLPATGDESDLWANIDVPLILALSGAAGVSEELLFRGLMLSALSRVAPWGVAAVAQGVAFGLVHAGYMTWSHVLGPLAFGLGMAWIARVLGVIPAMLLHAEVNVVFFALDVADVRPEALVLVAVLLVANAWAAWSTRLAGARALWASVARRGQSDDGIRGRAT